MDQQNQRGRSPSAGQNQSHISSSHTPSPGSYVANDPSAGLGLDLDQQQQHVSGAPAPSYDAFANNTTNFLSPQSQPYEQGSLSDPNVFDPNGGYGQSSGGDNDPSLSYDPQASSYLSPSLTDGDFSLFPPSGAQGDQFNAPLFEQSTLNPNDITGSMLSQTHQSPPSPHLQPGSAQQSPSFSQGQFSSPPGGHSRNVSLGPEAALLPNQMGEWGQPQFQGHRRTPSEYSDVSSVSPSPNVVTADSFDGDATGHSPLQRASDGSLYQEVLGIGNFSISDAQGNPDRQGRSPSHSPAISPRISPQSMPEINQPSFGLMPPGGAYSTGPYPGYPGGSESFPTLPSQSGADMTQMVPPAINIDFAPNNSKPNNFEQPKPHMDQASLTPPDRGRPKSRPRAVTDPFHPGGGLMSRQGSSQNLSPSVSPNPSSRSGSSRSLSPLDRQGTAHGRRRQSTTSVPNNDFVLRLADPEYQNSQEAGSSKRVQKHPATFQCTLCPKRFTRAYNLRSHLRTHTDERPFVCTVCGKAFARQHDRKRHESLHSGEKKFVCKGDLKAGGQWGCGRRFARADALGRHFRSEAGRVCIKPLLDEEMMERQRQWNEQQMQQNMAQSMAPPGAMGMDPSGFSMDNIGLPAALLVQYPALAQMNWSAPEMSGGMDDEMSGRSSFEASDYDEGDDGGYVSGPGTGFGEGGLGQNFGEMGYASDYGGR